MRDTVRANEVYFKNDYLFVPCEVICIHNV